MIITAPITAVGWGPKKRGSHHLAESFTTYSEKMQALMECTRSRTQYVSDHMCSKLTPLKLEAWKMQRDSMQAKR